MGWRNFREFMLPEARFPRRPFTGHSVNNDSLCTLATHLSSAKAEPRGWSWQAPAMQILGCFTLRPAAQRVRLGRCYCLIRNKARNRSSGSFVLWDVDISGVAAEKFSLPIEAPRPR